jgi:hypothetical protein
MGRPRPAAPLPRGENELQRSVGHSAWNRRPVDEGERLEGSLRCNRSRERRVTGERYWLPAGELGEDERPCRIAVGPAEVKAAQTGSAPRHYERADDTDRLAG